MASARATLKEIEKELKSGKPFFDGDGRWIVPGKATGKLSGTFVFTVKGTGKRREMGMGSLRGDGWLSRFRNDCAKWQAMADAGIDPIEARRSSRQVQAAKRTFGEIANALIASKGPIWGAKNLGQWRHTLTEYAKALRDKPVDEIDTADVLSVLQPIWNAKPETASRLRGRIEAVLDAARAQGLRSGENPSRWRGHLSHLLPKRGKLSRGHHAALPYVELPAFMSKLRGIETTAGRALEFTILTAARTGETLGSLSSEIDLQARVWTIPATRMKSGREHRVPLPDRAVEIIETMKAMAVSELCFPGSRRAAPLSKVALARVLDTMGVDGVTVHGFRSAFRDWAGNETHFPREVCEAALTRSIGDQAEQAYRRSDALEKRRQLMAAWADHCEPKQVGVADVLRFQRKDV